MNMIWFVMAFLFIALEVGHPGLFYFLSLSCGSFAAFLASYWQYSVYEQSVIFFLMTFICLGILHFFVKSTVHDSKSHRSNVEQLLGKTAMITELQSTTVGLGKVGGEIWSVKLQGGGALQVGMKVIVIGIQGCHLKVKLLESA